MKPQSGLEQAICESWPLAVWRESTIVIAASGGADSTALIEALLQIRPDPARTIVAHFNHALRGAESDADEIFVASIAAKYGLECIAKRATSDELASPSESSLRKLRHQFLRDVAAQHNARWIVMGHQADDQVETFLHHLLRGSGPSGLTGIQTYRTIDSLVDIVRPLLRVRRFEILEYLRLRDQTFRNDSSNATLDYTRNRIRNELLPSLRSFVNSESLDVRLLQAREMIAEEHAAFIELADRWLAKIGYASEEFVDSQEESLHGSPHFSVPVTMCRNEPWPIIREALVMIWHRMHWPLREMNHKHWRKLQQLIEKASQTTHPKRLELPGQILATCRKGTMRLERV
jgi:tRNA(Ile)-lysidine synthase